MEVLVLGLLADGSAHGYELLERARSRSIGLGEDVSKASVYQALARLESRRMVVGRVRRGAGGPSRRVYRITPAGLRHLSDGLAERFDERVPYGGGAVLALGFAHLLPAAEAGRAVTARERAVAALVEAVRAHRAGPVPDEGLGSVLAQAMLDRQEVLAEAELGWLRTFRRALGKMEGRGAPGPGEGRRPYLR